MRHGWLQYLNLNRTDNSTLEFNYRQQECAFWSEYMPSVVGVMLPTYRPFTEVISHSLFLAMYQVTSFKSNLFILFLLLRLVLVGTKYTNISCLLVCGRCVYHIADACHPLLLLMAWS